MIIKNEKYNLEIMIVEVSGPPHKVNRTHFLEDRNKIAKNLKAMLKHIVCKMEVPSVTLIKKIKLFGIQLYKDTVYIYSLSKPCNDSYALMKELEFPALGQYSVLHQSMPTFLKNFSAIGNLILTTNALLDEVFAIDSTQEILEENIEDPSPHFSPHKKQKLRVDEN